MSPTSSTSRRSTSVSFPSSSSPSNLRRQVPSRYSWVDQLDICQRNTTMLGSTYLGAHHFGPVEGGRFRVSSQHLLSRRIWWEVCRVPGYRNQGASESPVFGAVASGLIRFRVLDLIPRMWSGIGRHSRAATRKTYLRFIPSPPRIPVIVHCIHSYSAPFCFGNRYATSACI